MPKLWKLLLKPKIISSFKKIITHAAQVGSDKATYCIIQTGLKFQSTLPEGAAIAAQASDFAVPAISIHAARVGCDKNDLILMNPPFSISIHAARVGCDLVDSAVITVTGISIHAARVGCDYHLF